jgi:hypothetical protein
MWECFEQASLFVDVDYGQWGLEVLSPANSLRCTREAWKENGEELRLGDVVIGEFLGDQELVVIEKDGEIVMYLPLDGREDWYRVAPSLFLRAYVDASGEKYWEDAS